MNHFFIDTHAHLNFSAYKDDADKVIKRALENNVWMLNVGSLYENSKKAVEIAGKYEKGVFAAIGLHPLHLETGLVKIRTVPRFARQNLDSSLRSELKNDSEEAEIKTREEIFDYEKYKSLANSSKVVAIGEIGLDYYWKPKTKGRLELFKEKQRTGLCQQLVLAEELELPVIFHCRMAHNDLINILSQQRTGLCRLSGVVHCFTGNLEQAKKYTEMEFYLGFNGIIFKMNLDEIIKKTPLEKILIETDCPYLSPSNAPRRNEPIYVKQVAEKIAEIKGVTLDEVASITTENARKLFKI